MRETPYKSVPCKFLYDEAGSVLFEKITDLEEYYPYRAERGILEREGDSIVDAIPKNAVLVELGAGDCSKTVVLLSKMVARYGAEKVRFIAVDVSGEALRQAKESLKKKCGCIPEENITMIEDEYLNGLVTAQDYVGDDPLCVLWLGSSVGNFTREQAVDFFISMRQVLNDDAMVLLGTDLWKDEKVLMNAYNDSLGVTRDFIVNGMMHVLRACNHSMQDEYSEDLWRYEPCINHELTQVEMWVRAKQEMRDIVPGIHVRRGERLLVEISRKFTLDDVSALACLSHFVVHSTWKSSQFSLQLLGSVRYVTTLLLLLYMVNHRQHLV
jgi:dimethylhistidine N-methyltransferase